MCGIHKVNEEEGHPCSHMETLLYDRTERNRCILGCYQEVAQNIGPDGRKWYRTHVPQGNEKTKEEGDLAQNNGERISGAWPYARNRQTAGRRPASRCIAVENPNRSHMCHQALWALTKKID